MPSPSPTLKRLLLGFAGLSAIACAKSESTSVLTLAVSDSIGFRTLNLSHSLNDLAAGRVPTVEMASDLEIGGLDAPFGRIADVAALDSGDFAVLDRMNSHLLIFDSGGSLVRRLGGEGRGPGEFVDPWVVARVGRDFLIWQNSANTTFTLLDSSGHALATTNQPVNGDWRTVMFRQPHFFFDFAQMGPEDITRRLAALGDSGFLHQLQPDEMLAAVNGVDVDLNAPPVYVIRYDRELRIRDTVAVLRGPPSLFKGQLPGLQPDYSQPMFSGRPIWAVGTGWIAFAHGDSARVLIEPLGDGHSTVVTWPFDSRPITEGDRMNMVEFKFEHATKESEEYAAKWRRVPQREKRRVMRTHAFERNDFADRVPQVTAIYAWGECLFLSGFSSSDYPDGTARSLAVIDVQAGTLVGALRIPGRGERLRDIGGGAIYTTYTDDEGAFFLRRYPLPFATCSG